MPGMPIYGELYRAQLEVLSATPSAALSGRVLYQSTLGKAMLDNGSLVRAFLCNDAKLVIGNHATASTNVRINRSATATLQVLTGDDATAEGSVSTSLAQWDSRVLNSAAGSLPANSASTVGRLAFVTDESVPAYDTGAAWIRLVGLTATQTLSNKTLTSPTITTPSMTTAQTWTQVTTPSNPSAGFNKVYVKSGNTLCWLDSSGVEHTATETLSAQAQKNWVINGNFDFWQRATTLAVTSNNSYVADRFRLEFANTAARFTYERSTDVPTYAESGFQSSYSLKLDCTTADDGVIDAADFVGIATHLEGYTWAQLYGKQVTLSFWVKSTKTGTFCVGFRNNGADRAYVAEYTVSVTNTWEKKTISLTLDPSGGTEDYTTGIGLRIAWILLAGSNFQTTSGSWVSNSRQATSSQVNAADSTSNNFFLAQIKLNIGTTATDFERAGPTIGAEQELCERFYQKSYELATAPASATTVGQIVRARAAGGSCSAEFRVRMRLAPTVTLYSPTTGTDGQVRNLNSAADIAATSSGSEVSQTGYYLNVAGASSAGDALAWHWAAHIDY